MKDKAYEIALDPKYDGNQIGLASMLLKIFHKKAVPGVRATSTTGANVNEVLAQELDKPVIQKIKGRKVYSRFKDNRFWWKHPSKIVLFSKLTKLNPNWFMSKATYFLVSLNHGDILLKPMQRGPS